YKWTQWLFLKLYEKGLAYKKKSPVNWCPKCKTVLANEQVHDGSCERCDAEVTKKDLNQWYFKIRDYAERLLNFDGLDWPNKTRLMQEHWIGKSIGSEIDFEIVDPETKEPTGKKITVFTTRIDTLYGCTYMVLAPEHELVKEITTDKHKENIKAYVKKARKETDIERTAEGREKTGVETGAFAINPVNGKIVPIWIADYVLASYGTGAIMAVPAHDQRDFEFARKYNIPIKIVIQTPEKDLILEGMTEAYIEPGILVNSAHLDNMESLASMKAITDWMAENNMGEYAITYRLRDWGISRQRYWGTPIPVIYCDKCGTVLVPDKDLPVILPVNVKLGKTTQNPLLSVEDWVNTTCPQCEGPAKRETDTMDTFVDSSWYFLR
ncbi:MAG: leucine--tRNA ligase, partial [Candidatus Cloacimonetes bacterium]|nr:leucine--tRNA ligase [Candidatus Cloacimonadota bacterium]